MKRIVGLVAICFTLSLGVAAFAADGAKLGYVDLQKALNSAEAGKAAREHLTGKAKELQDKISAKEAEVKKLKDELEKQSVLLSESARGVKEKDYQQKFKELQRFAKDAQDELQAKDEELTNVIGQEIVRLAQEYGRKNGYSFIFVKNDALVLYAEEKADLTDEIVKLHNASRKK